MKTKTAEEILSPSVQEIIPIWYDEPQRLVDEEDAIDAMKMFSDQFTPKWVDTNCLHEVNMRVEAGWYGLLTKDKTQNIWHQEIKYIKRVIPVSANYYCKIHLPEHPKTETI